MVPVAHQQQSETAHFLLLSTVNPLFLFVGLELVACQVFGSDIGDDRAKHIVLSSFNTGKYQI